jgi:lipopolysaccharide export system permease protein
LLRSVMFLAIAVALLTGVASNVGRPWAFRATYAMQANAMAELGIDRAPAGQFVELGQTGHVLLAERVDAPLRRFEDVLVHTDVGSGQSRMISAHTLQLPQSAAEDRLMTFEHGSVYLLDQRGTADRVLEFATLALPVVAGVSAQRYRRKAATTYDLMHSNTAKDVAELQWRLAGPVTTLLLALLAVPLSHTSRRPDTQTRIVLAIVVYALLFSLFGVAHSLVERARVPAWPGLWWFYVPPLALLWLLIFVPSRAGRA